MKDCIEYQGKTLRVGYNMAVAIEFEKETGEVFNLLSSLKSATNIVTLFWIVLKKYNTDFKVSKEEFAETLNGTEYRALDVAVGKWLKEFYWVPVQAEAKGEGVEKNA